MICRKKKFAAKYQTQEAYYPIGSKRCCALAYRKCAMLPNTLSGGADAPCVVIPPSNILGVVISPASTKCRSMNKHNTSCRNMLQSQISTVVVRCCFRVVAVAVCDDSSNSSRSSSSRISSSSTAAAVAAAAIEEMQLQAVEVLLQVAAAGWRMLQEGCCRMATNTGALLSLSPFLSLCLLDVCTAQELT